MANLFVYWLFLQTLLQQGYLLFELFFLFFKIADQGLGNLWLIVDAAYSSTLQLKLEIIQESFTLMMVMLG